LHSVLQRPDCRHDRDIDHPTSRHQRKALRARAAATGRTESELVRELIDLQLRAKGTLGERAGRYLGQLDFDPASVDRDPCGRISGG